MEYNRFEMKFDNRCGCCRRKLPKGTLAAGCRVLNGWKFQCLRCLDGFGSDSESESDSDVLNDSDSCFDDADAVDEEDMEDADFVVDDEDEENEDVSSADDEEVTCTPIISQCLRQMSREGILSDDEQSKEEEEEKSDSEEEEEEEEKSDSEEEEEEEEEDDEEDDEDDEEEQPDLFRNKLFCFMCGTHINIDSFSAKQQKEINDEDRYCLCHSSTSSFNAKAVVNVYVKPKYRHSKLLPSPSRSLSQTSSRSLSQQSQSQSPASTSTRNHRPSAADVITSLFNSDSESEVDFMDKISSTSRSVPSSQAPGRQVVVIDDSASEEELELEVDLNQATSTVSSSKRMAPSGVEGGESEGRPRRKCARQICYAGYESSKGGDDESEDSAFSGVSENEESVSNDSDSDSDNDCNSNRGNTSLQNRRKSRFIEDSESEGLENEQDRRREKNRKDPSSCGRLSGKKKTSRRCDHLFAVSSKRLAPSRDVGGASRDRPRQKCAPSKKVVDESEDGAYSDVSENVESGSNDSDGDRDSTHRRKSRFIEDSESESEFEGQENERHDRRKKNGIEPPSGRLSGKVEMSRRSTRLSTVSGSKRMAPSGIEGDESKGRPRRKCARQICYAGYESSNGGDDESDESAFSGVSENEESGSSDSDSDNDSYRSDGNNRNSGGSRAKSSAQPSTTSPRRQLRSRSRGRGSSVNYEKIEPSKMLYFSDSSSCSDAELQSESDVTLTVTPADQPTVPPSEAFTLGRSKSARQRHVLSRNSRPRTGSQNKVSVKSLEKFDSQEQEEEEEEEELGETSTRLQRLRRGVSKTGGRLQVEDTPPRDLSDNEIWV